MPTASCLAALVEGATGRDLFAKGERHDEGLGLVDTVGRRGTINNLDTDGVKVKGETRAERY